MHGKIRWKASAALFADMPWGYPATFFHLGQFFQNSVKMHELAQAEAREMLTRGIFDMPADIDRPQAAERLGLRRLSSARVSNGGQRLEDT